MKADRSAADRCTALLPGLTLLLLTVQPVLDVLLYFKSALGLTNGMFVAARLLLFAVVVTAGFLLSRRKWIYLLAAGVAGLYLTGHILACRAVGYLDWKTDLGDQLRILLIPATTLSLMTFLRRNEKTFSAIRQGLVIDLILILAVELLSVITGTDPHTYYEKQIGLRGWFIWANTQSAILSFLIPPLLAWVLRRFEGKALPALAAAVIGLGMLFQCGTRLSFATMIATGLGMGVCALICGRRYLRPALAIVLVTLVLTGLYPLSPMHENQVQMEQVGAEKQALLSQAAAEYGVDPDARSTDDPEALAAAYRYSLQGIVDRFGLERTAKAYGNSLDQAVVFDRRLKQKVFCGLLLEEAPTASRLFGVELMALRQPTVTYSYYRGSFAKETEVFESENDFYEIYVQGGIVGLALLLLFFACFGVKALLALIRRFRAVLDPEFAAFAGNYCFLLAYAYATASVLRRINATAYLGVILAGLWYLSRREGDRTHAA